MKDYTNAPILDPDNYDPMDYKEGQLVKFKDGEELTNAIITDIDYTDGSVAVEYDTNGDDIPDEEITL